MCITLKYCKTHHCIRETCHNFMLPIEASERYTLRLVLRKGFFCEKCSIVFTFFTTLQPDVTCTEIAKHNAVFFMTSFLHLRGKKKHQRCKNTQTQHNVGVWQIYLHRQPPPPLSEKLLMCALLKCKESLTKVMYFLRSYPNP